MRRVRINFVAGLALVAFTVAGCSGEAPPDTVPVSGKVTYKGNPVTSGQVLFQPMQAVGEAATTGLVRPAVGTIGSDGRYSMKSFGEGEGVLPGEYEVAVISYADEPTPEEYAEGAVRKLAIPERYTNGKTSGLKRQVAAGDKPHVYDIELRD
jgi:hypothetical protein